MLIFSMIFFMVGLLVLVEMMSEFDLSCDGHLKMINDILASIGQEEPDQNGRSISLTVSVGQDARCGDRDLDRPMECDKGILRCLVSCWD